MDGRGALRFSYATIALPTLDPAQAVAALAAAGYAGVEWKLGEPAAGMGTGSARGFLEGNRCTLHLGGTDPAWLRRLCADAGLEIVGLGPYLDVTDTARLDEVMAFAAACGAPQIRLQAPRTPGGRFDLAGLARRTRDYLAAAEESGRRHGVRLVLELHHRTISPSASAALALVGDRDPDRIGVIYDAGNLVWEGYEGHDLALRTLGPHLTHVHLKNVAARADPVTGRWSYEWSPLDTGFVDVAALLATLVEHGYRGWVSIEDLSTARDPVATMRHNARYLGLARG